MAAAGEHVDFTLTDSARGAADARQFAHDVVRRLAQIGEAMRVARRQRQQYEVGAAFERALGALDFLANHSVGWWLTTEDLPAPTNRVSLNENGDIVIAYEANNEEAHKCLQGVFKGMLKEQGYEPAESAAVLSAAGIMGETIPPSLVMMVLASITTLSVAAFFVAGVVPAALLGLCLMAIVFQLWFYLTPITITHTAAATTLYCNTPCAFRCSSNR